MKQQTRLYSDMQSVFRAYAPNAEFARARAATFTRLRELVQSLGHNGDYDLLDVSFSQLKDSPNLYNLPLECAIVDKSRPEGLSPTDHNVHSLPLPYDASALSHFLASHSYSGTFIDTEPDLLGFNPSISSKSVQGPVFRREPGWGDSDCQANRFASANTTSSEPAPVLTPLEPFNSLYPVHPPVLRIKPRLPEEPEVHLSPACPSHLIRWDLLQDICGLNSPFFAQAASAFWLWLQTWGCRHVSPSTCAFMLSYVCINELNSKQDEELKYDDLQPKSSFYVRQNYRQRILYHKIPAPKLPSYPYHFGIDRELDSLLSMFFEFWATQTRINLPYTCIFSPLTGAAYPRTQKFRGRLADLDHHEIMDSLRQSVDLRVAHGAGTISTDEIQPEFWLYQPLVMSDPVLPYHNMAHLVTKEALHLLQYNAARVCALIKSPLPITEIFGDQAARPFAEMRKQLRLSQSIGLDILFGNLSLHDLRHRDQRQRSSHVMDVSRKVLDNFVPIRQVPKLVLASRTKIIQRLQTIVRDEYGKQYRIETFGSTRYKIDSDTSDLDIVIIDTERTDGFSPKVDVNNLPAIYNIRHLAGVLIKRGIAVTRVVPWATTPIVKCEDPETGIKVDLNVNDQLGYYNTMLISAYCELSPLLRPMLQAIKIWAKPLGLNDPSPVGSWPSFSSYSLSLMTIGFLQTQSLLPNLQTGFEPLSPNMPGGFWMRTRSGERVFCDRRFKLSPVRFSPPGGVFSSVREALCGWFRYWGYEYDYALSIMSIRDGGTVSRAERILPEADLTLHRKKRGAARTRSHTTASEGMEEILTAQSAPAVESISMRIADSNVAEGLAALQAKGGGEPGVIDAGDSFNVTDAGAVEASIPDGQQPRIWAKSALVVADPFIRSKNVAAGVIKSVVKQFKAECRRAVMILESGGSFSDLVVDDAHAVSHYGSNSGRGSRSGAVRTVSRTVPEDGVDQGEETITINTQDHAFMQTQELREGEAAKEKGKERAASRGRVKAAGQSRWRSHSEMLGARGSSRSAYLPSARGSGALMHMSSTGTDVSEFESSSAQTDVSEDVLPRPNSNRLPE